MFSRSSMMMFSCEQTGMLLMVCVREALLTEKSQDMHGRRCIQEVTDGVIDIERLLLMADALFVGSLSRDLFEAADFNLLLT